MSPTTDVSWVLDDPAFQDTFKVIRTPILTSGLPDTQNQIVLTMQGVIEIGPVDKIMLESDASRTEKSINIHSRSRLFDVMQNFAPDVVVYNGNQYKVMKVYDYSRYGGGFYAADAYITDLTTSNASMVPTMPTIFSIGVNLSGLEDGSNYPGSPNVDYGVPTTAEMDYQKSIGAAFIRLPGRWERIQPTPFGALDPTYLGLVQGLVEHGASINLPVLLDLAHNFGGRAISGVSHQLGDGTLTDAMFADLWTKLATIFSGNPGVYGYDIMNEPSNMPNAQAWPAAAQAAVTAIRQVDQATTIYCEGDNYSSAGSWQTVNGALNVIDPYNNIIYSSHCYFDRDSSGTYFSWVTENSVPLASAPNAGQPHTVEVGVQRVTQFVEWLAVNGQRGHMGEGGVAVDQAYNSTNTTTYNPNFLTDGWNVCLDNYLAYLRQNNISFTYWNAGPYSAGYPLGIEPQTINGVTVDQPQVAVIRKYTGIGWNTGQAQLIGPIRGQPAVASSPFELVVMGYFTEEQTYGLSDGGAGGVFTYDGQPVTSITLPPGFNQYASFTYTGISSPLSVIIAVTCPTGVTNVYSGYGYSTIDDPLANEPAQATNIFQPYLVNTTYTGPLMKVWGLNETSKANFSVFEPTSRVVGATVPEATVAAAIPGVSTSITLNGSTQTVTAWRVMLPDQGGLGNDQTFVSDTDNEDGSGGSGPLPSSVADLPILYYDTNGRPNIYANNSRVDAPSPIAGSTAQYWMMIAQPTTVASMQWMAGWNFVDQYEMAGNSSGSSLISHSSTNEYLPMGVLSDTLRVYSGQFQSTMTNGRQNFRDGVLQAEITSGFASIPYEYRTNARFFYYAFYPEYAQGLMNSFITFNNAIPQQATINALLAAHQAFYGTPVPPAQLTGLTLGTTTYDSQPLTWTAVPNATSYVINASSTTGTVTQSFTTNSGTVTGLLPNTAYVFTGYALDGYGIGPTSSSVSATTLPFPVGSGAKLNHIGVNLSGLENNPYPITPSQSDITYYLSKGFTLFRIPFDQKQAMPVLGGSLNGSYLAALDSTVAFITAGGGIAMIDSHNYGGMSGTMTVLNAVSQGANQITFTANLNSYATGASIAGLGIASNCTVTTAANSATVTLSANTTAPITAGTVLTVSGSIGTTIPNATFADFWSKMATRYVTNPNVRFDFQNEPSVSSTTWPGSLIAAAAAVRAAEAAASVGPHVIYYPFTGPNAGSASFDTGVNLMEAVVAADTGGKAYRIFEFHQYNDASGSGTVGTVASFTTVAERCDPIINQAWITGESLCLGEFAWGADGYSGTAAGALAAGANGLAYFGQCAAPGPLVELVWWGAGDFLSTLDNGYCFGIAPYNGQDTPFIAQLQAYMPGGAFCGYPQQAQKYPMVMANNNYVTASSGFGLATAPGNWGNVSPNSGNQGNCQFYMKARVTLQPGLPYNGTIMLGDANVNGICADSTGHLAFVNGGGTVISSSIVINDGQVHNVEYGVKNGYSYVFHEGVLVLTTSSAITDSNPCVGFSMNVGNAKNNAPQYHSIWQGTIEYAAYYGVCLYTATHAPQTTMPPLTGEPGRISLWTLDGNGTGLA